MVGDLPNQQFQISPLIRITLMGLYGALLLPLPVLAAATGAAVSPWLLTGATLAGWVALYGALGQQVTTSETGITVAHPRWIRWLWRQQWHLDWTDITALKPRSTGQGGLVYYFIGQDQQAYLLPMRIAGFGRLVAIVTEQTGIDTQDVRPLSQPWMYLILLGFTLLLLLVDAWTVTTAIQLDQLG